ncbi:MAG: hypothetical protein JRI95_16825 [Deltaproteobacteria bacterium]|nr:hypothetical protein [Deltaproteobacteria bacterium]
MNNLSKSNLPTKLARGRKCFEKWRRTHKPPTRLPEHLWSLAAQLAREYGLNKTARTLRLDYNSLKKRMEHAVSGEASKPIAPAPFLELLPAGPQANVECTIECEDGQGARIRIHLQGRELPDLAALSSSLWNGDR